MNRSPTTKDEVLLPAPAQAQQNNMSFFITSVGGDLGGLEGADLQCQSLAQAAGVGGKTWHAYLSTQGQAGVNAKDRIGNGPWFNAKGVQIASNIADLHTKHHIPHRREIFKKEEGAEAS
jgi:hypothetical protein